MRITVESLVDACRVIEAAEIYLRDHNPGHHCHGACAVCLSIYQLGEVYRRLVAKQLSDDRYASALLPDTSSTAAPSVPCSAAATKEVW